VARISHTRQYFSLMIARSRRKLRMAFYTRLNQRKLIRFLKGLLKEYPRVVVGMDNAPWHKGPLIRAFLRRNSKCLKLIYFPPYSPELNPVEQCNKEIKVPLWNRYFLTATAAQQAIRRFLKKGFLMPKMFAYLCP
jgi:transposase